MSTSKGHVLLIAYYYPPSNEAGAKRAEGFHRFLPEWGYRSTLITIGPETGNAALDDNVVRVQQAGYRQSLAGVATKKPGPLMSRLIRLYKLAADIPDGYRGFFSPACAAAAAIAARDPISAIIASSSPYTSLRIGSTLSRRLGVPWVADLRDLWTANQFGYPFGKLRRQVDAHLERRWLKTAGRVVTATRGLSVNLKSAGFRFDGSTVYNGFLDQAPYRPVEEGPFRIRFLGRLYSGVGHTPKAFFDALDLIRGHSPRLFEALEVEFFGHVNQEFWDEVKAGHLENKVLYRGQVSAMAAIQKAAAASLLLVLLPDTPAQAVTIPTKLFDYAATRRPVLFVGPAGEGADLVEAARLGRAFRSTEAAGMAQWIVELAADKAAGQLGKWGAEEQVAQFHYRWRARDMAQELDALLNQ